MLFTVRLDTTASPNSISIITTKVIGEKLKEVKTQAHQIPIIKGTSILRNGYLPQSTIDQVLSSFIGLLVELTGIGSGLLQRYQQRQTGFKILKVASSQFFMCNITPTHKLDHLADFIP